jgi:methyltransferase (TIGR00027 family)
MLEDTTHNERLGLTARWTAAMRARESRREDRLLNDPWAAALAGEDGGGSWIEESEPTQEAATLGTLLRTRYFDDFLLRMTREQAMRQVVLMAAGLDTRAYRLDWPAQTRLFELDQPQVLAYKEQILAAAGAKPGCERHSIAVDLTGSWTALLKGAGFDPQQPAIWVLEGFLVYLSNENIIRIFDDITALSAPTSCLCFDAINSETLTSQWTRPMIEAVAKAGVPWRGVLDYPCNFLAERGWSATLAQLGEEGLNFGRWPYPVIPIEVPDMPRFWFITAQRKS